MVIYVELTKNDKIELVIDALTSEGSGVGRYNGLAVFVRGTVPQDRITAHIIKRSKNYAIGIIDKIISPSPNRIESDCHYSQRCGGCSFRHMTYEQELDYKLSRVNDALHRIGHIDIEANEIVGADSLERYRNKAQYPVFICDGELFSGFYAYKSHRIVVCDDCALQSREFEQGIKAFSKWIQQTNVTSYDENSGRGLLRHIYFRKAFATGEIMACAVINGDGIPDKELLISLLREHIPALKSVVINVNKKKTNVILGDTSKTIWGSDTITDILCGKKFVVSPNSFYQVNHSQCEKLYAIARDFADLNGNEVLLDFYCGVGTIGLTMADSVKELIGIEIVEQAIENAKINAQLNGADNTRFICADAKNGAKILRAEGIRPDIIILDPPRKGCDSELLAAVNELSPKKIVYVSCDSATLARDLAVLQQSSYVAQKVVAVDMFPRTPHVESVVLMSRVEK